MTTTVATSSPVSQGLTWAAIGSGVLATLGGIRSYIAFLGQRAVAIPMQFGIDGVPTWFYNSPHAFLIYPLTTACLAGGCYLMSKSNPDSKFINYPFKFDEEQRETQHKMASTCMNLIGLLTNAFMGLLSCRYIPEIVAGTRLVLPSNLVASFLVALVVVTVTYVYQAFKNKDKPYARLE